MQNQLETAVIPVAGLGTRLLPATKAVPKELMPVYDRPLLQIAVDEVRAAGFKRLVLVNHPSKTAIEDYFERDTDLRNELEAANKPDLIRKLDAMDPGDALEIVFVHQTEQKGLGHAIQCARDAVDDTRPFAVLLPDDVIIGAVPALAEMAASYDPGMSAHMLATQVVPRDRTGQYGICACDTPAPGRQTMVEALVEKPDPANAPSQVAVVGRYILSPDIFDALADQPPGAGGEIQLTDAIARTIGTRGVSAFHITGTRFDCGNAEGLHAASTAFRNVRAA